MLRSWTLGRSQRLPAPQSASSQQYRWQAPPEPQWNPGWHVGPGVQASHWPPEPMGKQAKPMLLRSQLSSAEQPAFVIGLHSPPAVSSPHSVLQDPSAQRLTPAVAIATAGSDVQMGIEEAPTQGPQFGWSLHTVTSGQHFAARHALHESVMLRPHASPPLAPPPPAALPPTPLAPPPLTPPPPAPPPPAPPPPAAPPADPPTPVAVAALVVVAAPVVVDVALPPPVAKGRKQ
jgi:hypothetical protein